MKSKILVYALLLSVATISLFAKSIQMRVVVPELTNECWIVGNYVGWNLSKASAMTKIDQTHYQLQLNDSLWNDSVNTANMKYIYLKRTCDWTYVERTKNGGFVPERKYKENVVDTVAYWISDDAYEAPIDIYVTTPKGTEYCYLYGELFGNYISVGDFELTKYAVNSDSTVEFYAGFWSRSMCSNISIRFSSGPSLEFDQLLPAENFSSTDLHFVVKSWKSLFASTFTIYENNTKVFLNNSVIFIENTSLNEPISICDYTGKQLRSYCSKGETISFVPNKPGLYLIKTAKKTVKVIVPNL